MAGLDALILFDDRVAASWHPFTLTRPAGELLHGAFTVRERAERVLGVTCAGHIAPDLTGFDEAGSVPVRPAAAFESGGGRLFLCSRAILSWELSVEWPGVAALVEVGGAVAGWYAPAGTAGPPGSFLSGLSREAAPAGLPVVPLAGRLVHELWHVVARNAAQLSLDFERAAARAPVPPGTHVVGAADRIRLGERTTVEPGVLIDVSAGPVWVDDDVTVRAFTRLEGPVYIGAGSLVLGGSISSTSVGPRCRVRGEIEASIVLGYSNKAHDGFLGHAYVGRWVNLGAGTTNSDLKNNYGTVRVWTPAGERDTGEMKVGCFLGDHVKTAIGTRLNTGTVVGPGANLFGEAMPAKYVRPFAWGSDGGLHDLDRFLKTAETVMGRRGVPLTTGMRELLAAVWRRERGAAG